MPHKFTTKLSIYNSGRGLRSSLYHGDFGELLSKQHGRTAQHICFDSHKSAILLVSHVTVTGVSSLFKCVGLAGDCLLRPTEQQRRCRQYTGREML